MIRYDRLWATMATKGLTQYRLIKQYNFSAGQIGRLKKNMHVSTHTLNTLCSILGCGISDILEYIPEGLNEAEELPGKRVSKESDKASDETPSKQKKTISSKGGKSKKASKSKKNNKKAAKESKKGKDGKKNK